MTLIRILRNRVGRCRDACELAVNHGTPRRAAKLAVVVGTLLVLINQWEAVAGSVSMDWLKLVLTYCVPYLVSTYTSVSKDLYLLREAEAAEQAVHEEARNQSLLLFPDFLSSRASATRSSIRRRNSSSVRPEE